MSDTEVLWRGIIFWVGLGFCGLFALMILYDGIRLWWRGDPPSFDLKSTHWGWRVFQAVTFAALFWGLSDLSEGGLGYAPVLVSAALTFFFTYMLTKIIDGIRWLSAVMAGSRGREQERADAKSRPYPDPVPSSKSRPSRHARAVALWF